MLRTFGGSMTRIPRYAKNIPESNVRFVCSKGVGKQCADNRGCGKTSCVKWHQKRTFCTTSPPPENESRDAGKDYTNIITSPEVEKRIKMILLECEIAKQSDLRVPSKIHEKDMQELLEINTLYARRKYFHYLGTKEFVLLAEERKKEEKQLQYQIKLQGKKLERELTGHLRYGLGGNSMFMYIRKASVNAFHVSKLCRAAMFEQPLVFDMDFEEEMNKRELKNAVRQLQESYGKNRENSEPFDLYFCNMRPQNKMMPILRQYIPSIDAGNTMITLEERSYLDLFPKEKLVYLSPNASENLKDYDSDKIYIIGGIVDKHDEKPLTLAKAKREGIAAAKLPLDKYLLWGLGSKNLTLNQVVDILLEWKKTNDWNKAFRFVPTRKLKRVEDFEAEQQQKVFKLQKHKQDRATPVRKNFWGNRRIQGLFED